VSTETLVTLIAAVCCGVFITSALATRVIKKLKLEMSTALPTSVSIISLAATIFFGIVGMRLPAQAADHPPGGTSGGLTHSTSSPSSPTAPTSPNSPAATASTSPVTGTSSPVATADSTFIEGASDTPFAGKCVDVRGPSTNPDTPVQIWDCKQVDEMRWRLTSTGEIQGFGGNCLTVVGDDADATPVLMEPCGNTADQHWQMQPDGHLSYAGGRCLDIQGPSINDGTALQIWQCKNVPEELWQLTPKP
jgi:Ricin-type beta-trefoil lectin domain